LPGVSPVLGVPGVGGVPVVGGVGDVGSSSAAPVLGVPIATNIESVTPPVPGVPAPISGASSSSILQPVQSAASGLTEFLPLLTAQDLPGVLPGTNLASPTSLIPLFPDTSPPLPGSVPLAAAPSAPTMGTADSLSAPLSAANLSAPLSAAVPPLARGASILLSPQALDNLCPDSVWLASVPNLSSGPTAAVPISDHLVSRAVIGAGVAADGLAGDDAEEDFGDVQPRGACRREMRCDSGVTVQTGSDAGVFAGGAAVTDEA
jgi:hypothetical protein